VIERVTGSTAGEFFIPRQDFSALRIAVNEELTNLEEALEQDNESAGHAVDLVVISYHSLEDRIVKNFIRRESQIVFWPAFCY